MELLLIIKLIVVLLGIYEVLARSFPTIKDWSILGNIIKILKSISDAFNNWK